MADLGPSKETFDAVDEIFSTPRHYEVGRSEPCPVCGHASWCMAFSGVVLCHRIPKGAWKTYETATGPAYLHILDASHVNSLTAPRPRKRKPLSPINWTSRARYYALLAPLPKLTELANLLGVSEKLVFRAMIGWTDGGRGGAWTIPERDAKGTVVGIQRRLAKPLEDGRNKVYMRGSHPGLFYLRDLGDRAFRRTLLLVEGASDVLAAEQMGISAIGRPSNTGGVAHLLRLLPTLYADEIVVMGENDCKPNGEWPGLAGAVRVASELSRGLGRTISWALPPAPAKDVRDWLMQQRTVPGSVTDILLGNRFLSSLRRRR